VVPGQAATDSQFKAKKVVALMAWPGIRKLEILMGYNL
jgi:hypothetical protein